MSRDIIRYEHPLSDGLHPVVYGAMVGLVAWFVLMVWVLFGSAQYAGLSFAVVSGFFLIVVALPYALWRVWRKTAGAETVGEDRASFRRWVSGEFDTWTGRRHALDAAIEILLPILAAAVGLTALGIVFDLAASNVI